MNEKDAILVVEDEEIMRESLIAWFSGSGHTVHGVVDGDWKIVRLPAALAERLRG